MTDNELLLAISNMLDPIREDIKEVGERVIRIEKHVEEIDERVTRMEKHITEIDDHVAEIDGRVKKIELMQENIIVPRLQNIEECYISTFERYKTSVGDYEQIKTDHFLLKQVVMEHSEKLQKIS